MIINPLHSIDFYKADHRRQYPNGTQSVYSNFTPRSIKHLETIQGINDDKVVAFGLQYFIKYFLIEQFNLGFFNLPKEKVVNAYKRRMDNALGKGSIPVDHIEELHDLGYLPISIRALPEGTVHDARIPQFTIQNTKNGNEWVAFWLTNYLESVASALNWKQSTSATVARKYRQVMDHYAIKTGTPLEFVQFQGHDFSFRGMSGIQDAVMSGAGHLLSFVGTDTVSAIDFLEDYYGADSDKELVGCSVPATEHSVMSLGSQEGEFETFKRLITELYPQGIVSIVSDTWDFWKVVTEFLPSLKEEILARKGGPVGDKVVIRPDSGDPVKIIVGDFGAKPGTPEYKGAIECLWETFGGTLTEKGYKMLDSHIGLIYGDSITLDRCNEIMAGLMAKGFASSNVVLGIGSFTYEYKTRDTLGFAMKATAGIVNGEFREIFKNPKTDTGTKKSAKGYLAVLKDENGNLFLKDQVSLEEMENSELKEVFRDGKLLVDHKLSEIRKRIMQ